MRLETIITTKPVMTGIETITLFWEQMTGLILIFYTGTALVILFSFSEITKAFQFKLDVNTKYNNVALWHGKYS